MAIVSSYGALTAIASSGSPSRLSTVGTAGPFYDGYRRTYAQIYQAQPAVRTVVDFIARNIAQLGLQVFRRVSDVDRVRLTDHPLPQLLTRPNPSTTRYRFIESTVQDLCIFANAYWLKVRGSQFGLVRLPAGEVSVAGVLLPTSYKWTPAGGQARDFEPSEIVHFRMYDPANAVLGFPVIETLRRVLAEAWAAGAYREEFWKNSGRFESVIERPATAPKWSTDQRNDFRTQWQEFAGAKAGKTPVLEDGMTLRPLSFNAHDSQYVEGLKLTREFVAASWHVPLPMVGILDHATFSNIKEQHKQLYQDCLGPSLVEFEEELELQLVPEFDDVEDVYLEFNIAEKLKGAFEEQIDSLTKATGRPFMSANEARARLNLPRDSDPDSDRIASAAPGQGAAFGSGATDKAAAAAALRAALETFAARQTARLEKDAVDTRAAKFTARRWRQELAADLTPVLGARADDVALEVTRDTLALLVDGAAAWSPARIDAIVAKETA